MPSITIQPTESRKTLTSSWSISHTGTWQGHPIDTYYVASGATYDDDSFSFNLSSIPQNITVISAYIDYTFSMGNYASKADALIGSNPYKTNANTLHAPYTDLVVSALYGALTVPIQFVAIPDAGEESTSSSFYGGLGSHSTTATWSNVSMTIEYEFNVSKCTPPTLTTNKLSQAPGRNVTLSWSGAAPGALNAITGYMIRQTDITIDGVPSFSDKYYRFIASTETGGVADVPANAGGNNSEYYYDVITCGEAGTEYYSDPSNAVNIVSMAEPCKQPDVTVPTTTPPTGEMVAVTVSGAENGTNNPVSGYRFIVEGNNYFSSYDVEGTSAGGTYNVQLPDINDFTVKITAYVTGENDDVAFPQTQPANSVTVTTRPTAPTPPTDISLAETEVGVRVGVTLSWSGAKNGAGNAIVGYNIMVSNSPNGQYSIYKSVNLTTGNGTATVYASSVPNETLYFKVQSNGAYGINSAFSNAVLLKSVTAACIAPENVIVSTATAYPGAILRLSWNGALDGGYGIAGYQVYGADTEDGEYSKLIGEVLTSENKGYIFFNANVSIGSALYLKVKTLCELPEYDSALSEMFAKVETLSLADTEIGQGKTNTVIKLL